MKINTTLAYHLLYILSIILLLADTIRSTTTVQKYLVLNGMTWAIVIGSILTYLRITSRLRLNTLVHKITALLLMPMTLIGAIALSYYDYITPFNTAYTKTQIQYTVLYVLGLYLLYTSIVHLSTATLKKIYKPLLATGIVWSFLLALTPWIWPFDAFAFITREDSIVENMQVIAALASCVYAFRTARLLRKKHIKLHATLFFIAAGILFLVAGDEFTWGQRHLKYASPQYFLENNSQNEPSIHNMNAVDDFVSIGYIVIGLYGSVAWFVQKRIKMLQKYPLSMYIPPWFAANFFFISAFYNIYTRDRLHFIGEWGEPVELMLYSGVLITILCAYDSSKQVPVPGTKHRRK